MVITTFAKSAIKLKIQQIKIERLTVDEKRVKLTSFVKTNKKSLNAESRLMIQRFRYWLKDQKKKETKHLKAA